MRGVELRHGPARCPTELLHEDEMPDTPGVPRDREVRECLLCIHDEGWEHGRYAERDLEALEMRRASLR